MKSGPPQNRRPYGALGAAVAGAGSGLVAVLASSCCVGPVIAPLVVGVLGASGAAWAAGLKPYSPYLLLGSLALLLYGLWMAYKPRPACSPEGCRAGTGHGVKAGLWISVALWALAALLNVACGQRSPAPRHTALEGDLSPLRQQFNADVGKVRAIFLAAPT